MPMCLCIVSRGQSTYCANNKAIYFKFKIVPEILVPAVTKISDMTMEDKSQPINFINKLKKTFNNSKVFFINSTQNIQVPTVKII